MLLGTKWEKAKHEQMYILRSRIRSVGDTKEQTEMMPIQNIPFNAILLIHSTVHIVLLYVPAALLDFKCGAQLN